MVDMPNDQKLLHCTVRIECTSSGGLRSSGTGFHFDLFSNGNTVVPVVVTNRRLVEAAEFVSFDVTLKGPDGMPAYGTHIRTEEYQFANKWIGHPDPGVDLAIIPFAHMLDAIRARGQEAFTAHLEPSVIWTDEELRSLLAIEEITVVGYPNGLWDQANNVPIVRRGITATPVFLDYGGCREFLIDAACFPGSSGSPVLLVNQGAYAERSGGIAIGTRLALLGILSAGPVHDNDGRIKGFDVCTDLRPVPVHRMPLNLGRCIKAARILDFEPLLVARGLIVPPPGYVMRTAVPA